MKNIIVLIIIGIFGISSPAFADFNWGSDTYSTVGNQLIVDSTGDQPTLSTYGNLGTNDFIGELAVKNTLAMDGYTVAYDYNPQNTNGQLSNYNQPLPTGVALTKLQFAGFEGNPRAVQDVYVLTSEYNALSSQGQANSISTLTTTVGNQGNLIAGNTISINTLNNGFNQLAGQVGTDEGNIATNTANISTITTNQNNDESNISNLQTNQVADESNIASNTSSINHLTSVTKHEERQINQVSTVANTAYNNTIIDQQEITATNSVVASQGQAIQGQQNQINGLNNRVGALERTQAEVVGKIRILDTRKFQVNAFVTYSQTRSAVANAGLEVQFKLGSSYEERQVNELNKKLDILLGKKEEQERQSNIETYYTGNGVGMRNRF